MLLLQTAELTKVTTDAAGSVTASMNQQGPLFVLLWVLVLSACGIAGYFYLRYDKALQGHQQALAEARSEERRAAATEQALNEGHNAGLTHQMREQYERQIQALRDDRNQLQQQVTETARELRQQEGKSIQVMETLGSKFGEMNRLLSDMNYRLHCLESAVQGRPIAPPPPLATHL